MRLDGRVTKLKDRERRVKLFQEDSSYEVFLLTTQVKFSSLCLSHGKGSLRSFLVVACCKHALY